MPPPPYDPLDATVTVATFDAAPKQKQRLVRQHWMEQVEGAGAPATYFLTTERVVLGRSESADIQVNSVKASRQHALIERSGVDYILRDNDSRNGVYLNGLRIHSAVLREADTVQVTDCVFIYHEP